jgi:hypothetical protein
VMATDAGWTDAEAAEPVEGEVSVRGRSTQVWVRPRR